MRKNEIKKGIYKKLFEDENNFNQNKSFANIINASHNKKQSITEKSLKDIMKESLKK